MRLKALRRRTLRQARRELRRDNLTLDDYAHIITVCDDNDSLMELNERIEKEVNPWNEPNRLYGADWPTIFRNVWDWLVENWPAILKIILTIVPLLLDEGDKYEDT